MGTFSKHHRYRDAGESANVNNVMAYGEPIRSLFTSTKVWSLHHKTVITDAVGNIVYSSESKAFSLADKTDIYDEYGNFTAHIERKFFSIHQIHYITMSDGFTFELSNELFHIFKDITNINGLGWQLRGNIWGLNFELYDQNNDIIAVISQKMMSIHDKYCIDIYKPEHEKIVVAILITLQHMIRDRQASASSSSAASAGG